MAAGRGGTGSESPGPPAVPAVPGTAATAMSAQSLLNSVFSCSSPAAAAPAKSLSKRRLRQTRSLDPAIIGGGQEHGEGAGRAPRARAAGSPPEEHRRPRGAPPPPGASFSTPSTPLERSPPGSALFDEDSPRGKRSPGWELPFLTRTPSASALSGPPGPANSIFSSPRRWLQQRKGQPSPSEPRPAAYVVWKSEVGAPAHPPGTGTRRAALPPGPRHRRPPVRPSGAAPRRTAAAVAGTGRPRWVAAGGRPRRWASVRGDAGHRPGLRLRCRPGRRGKQARVFAPGAGTAALGACMAAFGVLSTGSVYSCPRHVKTFSYQFHTS